MSSLFAFCFVCTCTRVGVPQPRIEWYKDAVPLSKLANPRYKVTSATGLTVRRVQPGDGGIFQCFARNAAGETQAHTELLVSSECVLHDAAVVSHCNFLSHLPSFICARLHLFHLQPLLCLSVCETDVTGMHFSTQLKLQQSLNYIFSSKHTHSLSFVLQGKSELCSRIVFLRVESDGTNLKQITTFFWEPEVNVTGSQIPSFDFPCVSAAELYTLSFVSVDLQSAY